MVQLWDPIPLKRDNMLGLAAWDLRTYVPGRGGCICVVVGACGPLYSVRSCSYLSPVAGLRIPTQRLTNSCCWKLRLAGLSYS